VNNLETLIRPSVCSYTTPIRFSYVRDNVDAGTIVRMNRVFIPRLWIITSIRLLYITETIREI